MDEVVRDEMGDGPHHKGLAPFSPLAAADHAALAQAVAQLEQTHFAQKLAQVLGRQADLISRHVPARLQSVASQAATLALKGALHGALTTLQRSRQPDPPTPAKPRLHKALAMASGAVGGAFGLASLPVELPISTGIMLRAIADIARAQGEDLTQPEAALACLQVFALGGQTSQPPAAGALPEGTLVEEGSYFAVRAALAATLSEAARSVVNRGLAGEAAPAVVRLISLIAARFGLVVSQKAMAQALPLLGAASGAAVNYAFTQHFQSLAQGHFTVRRLERVYGAALVRDAYHQITLARTGDRAKVV